MLPRRLLIALCLLVTLTGLLCAQPAPDAQPDLSLRWGGGAFIGKGVINNTGAPKEDEQQLQITLPHGAVTQVALIIANTSASVGDFRVRVSALKAGWNLTATIPSTLYMRETDITAPLTSDIGWPLHLLGNTAMTVQLQLTAPAQDSTLTLGISAIYALAADQSDALQLVARSTDTPLPAGDLLAKPAGMPDTSYVGLRRFAAIKDIQATGSMLASNQAAAYLVKLVNTTAAPQSYRLAIPTHPKAEAYRGMVIRVFDAAQDGMDITEAVAAPGGRACQVTGGGERLFRVEITNGTPNDTLVFSLPISVYAGEDRGPLLDTVTVNPSFQPALQPDVMLKLPGDAAYTGENIYYNPYDIQIAGKQQMRVPFTLNTPLSVLVRIRNITDQPRSYRLMTTGGKPDATLIQYFDAPQGGKNVTDLATAATWYTPMIPPHGVFDFRVEFTALAAARAYSCSIVAMLPGVLDRDSVYIHFMGAK